MDFPFFCESDKFIKLEKSFGKAHIPLFLFVLIYDCSVFVRKVGRHGKEKFFKEGLLLRELISLYFLLAQTL
jgi:hypothetical protein